ncbi:MAG: cytochrome c3 family protein [Chloroherpetonaceae bacterium]|nr:cytochrome c family protein [Chthonomonadaceae bacterium]MDW8207585.1 cytochrome c3 family protein [Chloroherpetonaceae bacterium]
MAQVFHPAANTLAKISLVLVAVGPLALICTASAISRSAYNTKVGVPIEQPIPFSHEHHVNELGIDCRYCHTSVEKSAHASIPATETCMSCHSQIWTNSPLLEPVRESYRTGTPIKWNVVNKVPEFVYFNHSIHINRGIKCNTCHGPIQKMQLVQKGQAFWMAWCLECHRNPEIGVGKREDVFAFYERVQMGDAALTPEERALANGVSYKRTAAELEEARKLVAEYGIKTKQLSDCWICHR